MADVLVTGATGFVGGAVVYRLLHEPRVRSIAVLARASSEIRARERVLASARRFGALPPAAAEIDVLAGDLADVTLSRRVVDSVTHVVHAAACTSFRARRVAWRTNVEGTRRLALQLRGGARLERFLYVGTAYACGARTTPVVREDDPPAGAHVAEYTRTKLEAEAVLASMEGLPCVVARPSMVIGHTTLGVAPSASLFWYSRALAMAGIAPYADARKGDIVSVDYVADALVELLFRPTLSFALYHVSAGAAAAVRWDEIRTRLAGPHSRSMAVAAEALAGHPAWRRVVVDDARFRRGVEACARFSALPIEYFSNERLLAEGFAAPLPFTSWIDRCLATSDRTVIEQLRDDGVR